MVKKGELFRASHLALNYKRYACAQGYVFRQKEIVVLSNCIADIWFLYLKVIWRHGSMDCTYFAAHDTLASAFPYLFC